ncbi:MAG: helix-turn-helix domain-containing protein [Candidatus Nanoarchaeia archaeon]|nr:helix-turn-helix domain-containing protein [Candidatus Nanoarchaeia archaeon]
MHNAKFVPELKIEKYFFIAPNLIFELGLNAYEISIYMYLLRCGNNSTAFPSYKTIGYMTGTSKDTAIRIIKKLISKGLVIKHSRPNKTDDGIYYESNIYEVRTNLEGVVADSDKGGSSQLQGVVADSDKGGSSQLQGVVADSDNKNNYIKKELIKEELTKKELTSSSEDKDPEQNNNDDDENKNTVKISKKDKEYINKYIAEFKIKYKAVLRQRNLEILFIKKGKEKLDFYLENYSKFLDSTKKIGNISGYFYTTVLEEYPVPKIKEAKVNKPIQATNYEQREYDDEFFDSLYVNLDEYKK